MAHTAPTLNEALVEAQSSIDRIAHVFFTHDHGDHYLPEEALLLAEQGTMLHMAESCWKQHFREPIMAPFLNFSRQIEQTGMLKLLPPSGQQRVGSHAIHWQAFDHGSTKNLTYRIDDTLVSGDVPLFSLFNPDNPESDSILDLTGNSVRAACLQMTHLSRREMLAERTYSEERINRITRDTGTLEQLEQAMAHERFEGFLQHLDRIVPHHFRRWPLKDTAHAIRERLLKLKERHGFNFDVVFESDV